MPTKQIGDAELTQIAVYIGANPQLKPCEINQWIMETYKVGKATAYSARSRLKKMLPATPTLVVAPKDLDAARRLVGTPVLDKMPTDPLTARQTIIDSLYDQMQNAMRPDDRIKAGKELARMLGYHREDVQDEMRGATRNQEDEATKCKRIANALRKALGLPEVIDAPQRDVPAVPAKLDSGSEPAAAVLEG